MLLVRVLSARDAYYYSTSVRNSAEVHGSKILHTTWYSYYILFWKSLVVAKKIMQYWNCSFSFKLLFCTLLALPVCVCIFVHWRIIGNVDEMHLEHTTYICFCLYSSSTFSCWVNNMKTYSINLETVPDNIQMLHICVCECVPFLGTLVYMHMHRGLGSVWYSLRSSNALFVRIIYNLICSHGSLTWLSFIAIHLWESEFNSDGTHF